MNPSYVTLESMAASSPSSRSNAPSDFTGFDFVGYDSSGVRRDPKGVMRLIKTHEPRKTLTQELEQYHISLMNLSGVQPREAYIGRSQFESQFRELEERIRQIEHSWKFKNIINYDDSELGQMRAQYQEMQRIMKQVNESLESPRVYRESRGRLVNNPVINGVEYTVNMAWTQTQIGEGSLPYFLKGDELVVSDSSKQIVAHRYFNDPRVVVHGTFEGDVRRPTNFSTELNEQTKANLTILFKQLYREIEEVAFPNEKKPVN